MAVTPNSPGERKRRNLTFAAVAVFGVAALVLGYVQLLSNIRKPLVINRTEDINALLSDDEISRLGDLRQKDTDGDGLSDYDELYTYRTSPYLKDSDSDGIDDKTEIQAGSDPNCPQGKTCGAIVGQTNANASAGNVTVNTSNGNVSSSLGVSNVSASTLRETLKNAGVPQTQLDALDDATLLQLYQQVLSETPTNTNGGGVNSNAAPAANSNLSLTNIPVNATISKSTLESLSPAEIRQLLIQAGVDANQLQTIDDVTLRAIFLQAIEGGTPAATGN